jgi:hypothetical protein
MLSKNVTLQTTYTDLLHAVLHKDTNFAHDVLLKVNANGSDYASIHLPMDRSTSSNGSWLSTEDII